VPRSGQGGEGGGRIRSLPYDYSAGFFTSRDCERETREEKRASERASEREREREGETQHWREGERDGERVERGGEGRRERAILILQQQTGGGRIS